jgi:hypothetical protein
LKTINLLSVLLLGAFMLPVSPAFAYDCSDPYLQQNDPNWAYYCQPSSGGGGYEPTPGSDDQTISNGGWEKAIKECEYGKPKCK